MTEHSLKELQERFLLYREHINLEDLEADIRQSIKASKSNPENEAQLRLLLGNLYMHKHNPIKARAQYKKALERDPDSIQAMLDLGNTYRLTSRVKYWAELALQKAENKQNCTEQLAALDRLACVADFSNDTQALSDTLNAMCRIISSAPRMNEAHTMIGDWLVMNKRGHLALPYAECLLKHMLELAYPRQYLVFALRLFIGIQDQASYSEEEISEMLNEFRLLAADEETANNFDTVLDWAWSYVREVYSHADEAKYRSRKA